MFDDPTDYMLLGLGIVLVGIGAILMKIAWCLPCSRIIEGG